MSNVQSYNALIDRFHAFASGHFILKRFSHGQIEVSDLEKFGEYPFMHVVPSNVSYAKGMKTFSFQIVLADLPRDKEDKPEYQREVLSDLQRIAEDLVAEITNHRVLFGDLITVQNVSLEPFLEEFQHTLTGWTISLDLLVPYYWDACSIPAEWNDFFESSTGGTGSILTFIDSITRDANGNVSLVNDEAEPSPNYYYGTDDEGVRGWYLLDTGGGLTCETIGDCQTIIDIEAAIDALEEEILLKANTTDISAVGFSNDYDDLDNKPTIPDVSGFVPYTGATTDVDLGVNNIYTNKVYLLDEANDNHGSIHYSDGDFHIEDADGHKLLVIEDGFMQLHLTDTIQSNLFTSDLTATRDHYLPNQSGTIALTSDIPSIAGLVPNTRTISTTSPLSGGGNLTADRTLSIAQATTSVSGYLSATDWATFNGKQAALGFTPENTANKQNSLAVDGTGVKFPTVDAVNTQSMIDKGKRMISFFTDFLSNNAIDGLNSFQSGGTAGIVGGSSIPNRTTQQGVVFMQTSVLAVNYINYCSSQGVAQLWFGNGAWNYETSININNLSTAAERYRLIFGYGAGSGNTAEGDGVFFTYDEGGTLNGTAASPNWQCVTVQSSTRTLTTTSTAVAAATWLKLRIEINAAGTSAAFYLNGTLLATHTTNIPLGSNSRYVLVKQGIAKTIGTTSRGLYVDYIGYENIQTTPRT